MKKCYLDSNILINFVDQESQFYARARNLLHTLRVEGYVLIISPLTIDEFLYQTKYYLIKRYKKQKVWQGLRDAFKKALSLPNLELANPPVAIDDHINVLDLMQKYNLFPRDAYHLFIVLSNNIDAFATFDSDFEKVKEVEIVGLKK